MKKLLLFFSTLTIISTPLVSSFKSVDNIINLSSSNTEELLNNLRPTELEIANELEKTHNQRAKVLNDKKEQIQKELNSQQEIIAKLQNELQTKRDELNQLIEGTNSTSDELNAQKQQLVKQLKDLINQQNQLSIIIINQNKQIKELIDHNSTINEEVLAQKQEIHKQTSSINTLNREKDNLLKTSKEHINQLNQTLNKLKNNVDQLNSNINTLKSKVDNLKIQSNNLEQQLQQVEQTQQTNNQTIVSNKTKLEELDNQNQIIQQQVDVTGLNQLKNEEKALQNAKEQLEKLKANSFVRYQIYSSNKLEEFIGYNKNYYDSFFNNFYQNVNFRPPFFEFNSNNYTNIQRNIEISINLKSFGVFSQKELKEKYENFDISVSLGLQAGFWDIGSGSDHLANSNSNFNRSFNPDPFKFKILGYNIDSKLIKTDDIVENQWVLWSEIKSQWTNQWPFAKIKLDYKIHFDGVLMKIQFKTTSSFYYHNSWESQPFTFVYFDPFSVYFKMKKEFINDQIKQIKNENINAIINKYKQ